MIEIILKTGKIMKKRNILKFHYLPIGLAFNFITNNLI